MTTEWKNPNPRFVVDGHEYPNADSNLAGDGQYPPFRIFNTDKQDYLPGKFNLRASAEAVAAKLNEEAAS